MAMLSSHEVKLIGVVLAIGVPHNAQPVEPPGTNRCTLTLPIISPVPVIEAMRAVAPSVETIVKTCELVLKVPPLKVSVPNKFSGLVKVAPLVVFDKVRLKKFVVELPPIV